MKSLFTLALLAGVACAPDPQPDPATGSVAPAAEAASRPGAAAPAPTDPQIAAIVVAANSIDAELGDLAVARGSSAEIREFGKTMSRDHRAVNAQAAALVQRLGVEPEESDISRSLRSDADAFRAELERKTGAEFDRSYIEHEVAFHQAVIDAVDEVLLPNARNAELKQTIANVRPALVAHLEHARQLAAKHRP